jgi:hypothetical protein
MVVVKVVGVDTGSAGFGAALILSPQMTAPYVCSANTLRGYENGLICNISIW